MTPVIAPEVVALVGGGKLGPLRLRALDDIDWIGLEPDHEVRCHGELPAPVRTAMRSHALVILPSSVAARLITIARERTEPPYGTPSNGAVEQLLNELAAIICSIPAERWAA